jgi:hypothetical protein
LFSVLICFASHTRSFLKPFTLTDHIDDVLSPSFTISRVAEALRLRRWPSKK